MLLNASVSVQTNGFSYQRAPYKSESASVLGSLSASQAQAQPSSRRAFGSFPTLPQGAPPKSSVQQLGSTGPASQKSRPDLTTAAAIYFSLSEV